MVWKKFFGKCWNLPSDRELLLRAKLNIGWSVHTGNLFQKIEIIPQDELETIENVIRRANEIERLEVERVGRMLCRLENMTNNTLGDGEKSCSMCGTAFGFFDSYSNCVDCIKAVCEKCRIDISTTPPELQVLCKICSENREVWKKSGGWFYGKFPTMSEACQKECISQITSSPGVMRAFNTWEHRAPDIVRLESFEPPEENHNENTLYKDWTTKSTLDLSTLDEEDLDYIELEPFRKSYCDQTETNTNLLTVQSCQLSSSCPVLAELQEPPRLIRKASIRRKKGHQIRKNVKKFFKSG